MAALLAKSEKAKEVIAVYHKPTQSSLFNSLGINHLICLHKITTKEIMEEIEQGQIGSTISKMGKNMEIIRLIAGKNSIVTTRTLSETWAKIREDAIIGAFIRDNMILIPQGKDKLEDGDDAIIITNGKRINAVKDLFKTR